MLELMLVVAATLGMTRAAKARHSWAMMLGAVAAYLLVADTLASLDPEQAEPIFVVFSQLFLGPGASFARTGDAMLLPTAVLTYPLVTRGVRLCLWAAASSICLWQSAKLNPLLKRAYELDAVALPFAGAAVIETLLLVVLLAAWGSMDTVPETTWHAPGR